MSLRNELIRLAHSNPELRKDLLPLLKESAEKSWWEQDEGGLYKSVIPLLARAVKRIRGVVEVEKEWENAVGVSFYYEPTELYYYLYIPTPSYDQTFTDVVLQYGEIKGDLQMGREFVGPEINKELNGDWKSDQRTIINFVAKSLKQKHRF